MISDILSDAVESIKEYQKSALYQNEEMTFYIDRVKAVMNAFRCYLDWPPPYKFEEGIGWCIYCGNTDPEIQMVPSEMYRARTGVDALVCAKCAEQEEILLRFRNQYRGQDTR